MGTQTDGHRRRPPYSKRMSRVLLLQPHHVRRELWNSDWLDPFDSNHKLRKSISYYNDIDNVPKLGWTWDGVASAAVDFQNSHETVGCGFGNPWKREPYIDTDSPKEYFTMLSMAHRQD
jgi:hypothetical protein